MKINIALEWDADSGFSLKEMYPLREQLEAKFESRSYGSTIARIGIVMTCLEREVGKPRKKFQKATGVFTYDIILDYPLISMTAMKVEKKDIIKRQIVEISEQTFSNYKFDDFDKDAFLRDLKKIVIAIKW
jgi:hypothetical protein